jgi:IclR family transcriptional regulator, KDG regulon repressor
MQTIDRIGRMLWALAGDEPSLTLSECASAADLNKSSAHRLLSSLQDIGLVERDAGGWRLGVGVVQLATARHRQLDLRHEVAEDLQRLGREYRAAVALSVPNGSDMVYIDRRDSPETYAPSARLGATAPMWAGAAGRAVLARLPPAERERRLSDERWLALPLQLRSRVLDEIAEAHRRGYAMDQGLFFDGIAGVAAAITDPTHVPIAAISVIFPPERLAVAFTRRLGKDLLDVVTRVEAALGADTALPEVAAGS